MKNQIGQSLVEALIALGAAAVIVSAITVAAISAVNNADFSKYQNLATQYAQQGMEIIRGEAQTWTTLYARAGSSASNNSYWCLDQSNTFSQATNFVCNQNINNEKGNPFFVREVILLKVLYVTPTPPNDNIACNGNVKATVKVSWTDGKCPSLVTDSNHYCHNVTLDSCFANVNAVPTP